jgi:hypothetical protein
LQSLAHGVKFGRRAEVAEERGDGARITKSRKCLDEIVETSCGFQIRSGGDYFATGHFTMLIC